jgi:hypothetical protein
LNYTIGGVAEAIRPSIEGEVGEAEDAEGSEFGDEEESGVRIPEKCKTP